MAYGCVATRWNETTIHPGLQALRLLAFKPASKLKFAGVQAGARHAAQAAGFHPGLQALSLLAFKPARGMPCSPITAHSATSNCGF